MIKVTYIICKSGKSSCLYGQRTDKLSRLAVTDSLDVKYSLFQSRCPSSQCVRLQTEVHRNNSDLSGDTVAVTDTGCVSKHRELPIRLL